MFVELVFGLYEEHEDTLSGSLTFTVCSTYTAPARACLPQAELSAPLFLLSSGVSSTGAVLKYEAHLSFHQQSAA